MLGQDKLKKKKKKSSWWITSWIFNDIREVIKISFRASATANSCFHHIHSRAAIAYALCVFISILASLGSATDEAQPTNQPIFQFPFMALSLPTACHSSSSSSSFFFSLSLPLSCKSSVVYFILFYVSLSHPIFDASTKQPFLIIINQLLL